jgi:CHAT domain-containing protein
VVLLGDSAAIRTAIDDLSKRGEKECWTAPIAKLRKLLVAPLALEEEIRTVLLSPDGPLGRLPFALLLPGRDVALAPSGTLLGILCERDSVEGRGTLAVADPAVPDLPTLPSARAEAKAIGDVVLLGEAATEAALFARLAARKRWRALHFACHGLLDEKVPWRSALVLTPEKGADGLLTCGDLFFRTIPADLVVLSACDTGRGKVYSTEGVVGLSRAFLMAGAPRVVGSLWKVDDAATSALMVEFHRLLKRGHAAAAALREAQEFVRSREAWSHPRFWAAWVLWGLPE